MLALSYEKFRFFAFRMVFREIIAEKLVRRRSIDRNAINIITIFNLERERSGWYARIGPRMIANSAPPRYRSPNSEFGDYRTKNRFLRAPSSNTAFSKLSRPLK